MSTQGTDLPDVSHRLVFELLTPRGPRPVTVTVSWWADMPYEVEVVFRAKGHPCWFVGRDLLADGLYFAAGEGDVRLRPDEDDPEWLRLTLSSPTGEADFRVPTHALGGFLSDTFAVVPAGCEQLPDAFYEELIAG